MMIKFRSDDINNTRKPLTVRRLQSTKVSVFIFNYILHDGIV